MVTPTIFSDVAANPLVAKVDRSGAVTDQRATVVVPASTAAATVIGMIRFQQGFSPTLIRINAADLDSATTVTLSCGYVYDSGASGSDVLNAFMNVATIAQTGGSFVWPVAGGLTNQGFTAAGAGYLSISITAGPTTTLGNVVVEASFTYNA